MKRNTALSAVVRDTLRRKKALTAGLAALIAASVGTSLLPPLVLEQAVNRLTAHQAVPLSLALAYFALLAVSGLLEAGQQVVITVFGQKITRALRSAMCAKLSRLPAGYFTAQDSGAVTSRFVNDVDTVDDLFTSGVISMFADACRVVSILLVIFWKSTGLGLLMLVVTPLLFALTRRFQKRMLRAQLDNRAAVARVANHVPETVRNLRTIHNLLRQQYMEARYDRFIQESYRATEKSNFYDAVYSPIVVFTSSCVIAVMMVCSAMSGGMRSFFGLSVGAAVAVIAYVGKVFDPLENIGMEIQNIQSAVAGVRRINAFLDEPERERPVSPQESPRDAAVEFDDVTFGYGGEAPVLTHLSFAVRPGESVTLAGRTGAGKSTAFRLLLGLYSPDRGRVAIGGMDAAAIPENQKRRLYGCVEQSFHAVPGTVLEQITLSDPAISRTQAEQAAALAGLTDAIAALPQGFDTPMGEGLFSQGQLQLLSIARAVAADPPILLLDESTANLDSITERRVLDALQKVSAGRTVLSISHRLSEVNEDTRIIFIGENA